MPPFCFDTAVALKARESVFDSALSRLEVMSFSMDIAESYSMKGRSLVHMSA